MILPAAVSNVVRQFIPLVVRVTKVPSAVLLGTGRTAPAVRARQIGYFLARRFTTASTTRVAQAFGRGDHTTVVYAMQKMAEVVATIRTRTRPRRGRSTYGMRNGSEARLTVTCSACAG